MIWVRAWQNLGATVLALLPLLVWKGASRITVIGYSPAVSRAIPPRIERISRRE